MQVAWNGAVAGDPGWVGGKPAAVPPGGCAGWPVAAGGRMASIGAHGAAASRGRGARGCRRPLTARGGAAIVSPRRFRPCDRESTLAIGRPGIAFSRASITAREQPSAVRAWASSIRAGV